MLKISSSTTRFATASLLSVLLAGCGGGDGDKYIQIPPALDNSPGGQYFGYYVETDDNNDPAVGGVYLDIPNSEGNVKGRMSFQYVDCQRTNALEIKAQKLTRYINAGRAEGTIDSTSSQVPNNVVNFSFVGEYSRNNLVYSGKYNLLDGATGNRVETDCNPDYHYTLSNKGDWTVYPANLTFPSTFNIAKDGRLVFWNNAPSIANKALVNVIDPQAVGTSSQNGFVLQRIVQPILTSSTLLPEGLLQAGKQYIVVVQLFDANNKIVAFQQQKLVF